MTERIFRTQHSTNQRREGRRKMMILVKTPILKSTSNAKHQRKKLATHEDFSSLQWAMDYPLEKKLFKLDDLNETDQNDP